ncbi:MAG: hypothetical protein RLZZ24_167, partial [Pseudomonadota bacterium]
MQKSRKMTPMKRYLDDRVQADLARKMV